MLGFVQMQYFMVCALNWLNSGLKIQFFSQFWLKVLTISSTRPDPRHFFKLKPRLDLVFQASSPKKA